MLNILILAFINNSIKNYIYIINTIIPYIMNYIYCANIILFIHIIGTVILLFGFILPKKYLLYYLMILPLVFLNWLIDNNNCFLTKLEYTLRGEKQQQSNSFISDTLQYLNFDVSEKFVDNHIHIIFIIPWLIACVRLYKNY